MTISFRPKGSKLVMPIKVRVSVSGRIDQSCSLELFCRKSDWNPKKQRFIPSSETYTKANEKLQEIESKIIKAYTDDTINGRFYDNSWLKDVINDVFNTPLAYRTKTKEDHHIYFIDWCEHWLDENKKTYEKQRSGKRFSDDDLKRYAMDFRAWRNFEKYKKKRYRFTDFSKSLKLDFMEYCATVRLLSDNTFTKMCQDYDFFIKRMMENGINYKELVQFDELSNSVSDELKDKIIEIRGDKLNTYITLHESEIQAIRDIPIFDKELEAVRDCAMIGLRTGMRLSDFYWALKDHHIHEDLIIQKNYKTGVEVKVPIHPDVRAVLKKWNGIPPRLDRENVTEQRFNNHFNDNLKIIAEKAGVNRLVLSTTKQKVEVEGKMLNRDVKGMNPIYKVISSHICRRTMATQMHNTEGVTMKMIMEILGWTTEKMANKYIKIKGIDSATKLSKVWERQLQTA